MAIDPNMYDAFTSGAKRSFSDEEENKVERDTEVFDLGDTLMAPLRGIEGAVKSFYDLGDYVLGDALPDYDTRLFGTSNTMVGGFVEGVAQFATGFVPIAGQLGKIGRLANARKFLGKEVAEKLAKGGKLTFKEKAILAKNTKKKLAADGLMAGTAADFLVFDAQEERLSNLLYQFPALQNPVTEYLKASDEDGEIEGRFKNVIEGLFMEAGMAAVTKPFMHSLKMLKNRNKKLAEGVEKEDAVDLTISEADPAEVAFDYEKINDPITGINGQSEAKLTVDDVESFVEASGITFEDLVIDPATGAPKMATAGAGGRKATPEDIYNYWITSSDRVIDTPNLKQFYDIASEGANVAKSGKFVDELLGNLEKNTDNLSEKTKTYAGLLKRLRTDFKDSFEDINIDVDRKTERAFYEIETNSVRLKDTSSISTVVHEYVHGLSSRLIDKYIPHIYTSGVKVEGSKYLDELQRVVAEGKTETGEEIPASIREMVDLYVTAADRLGQSQTLRYGLPERGRGQGAAVGTPDKVQRIGINYGLGDLHEFVAQAFMNAKFQRELASITISKGKKPVTAYDKFKSLISKLLGFNTKESTLLDEFTSVADRLFRDNENIVAKGRDKKFSTKFKGIDAYDDISALEKMSFEGTGAKFSHGVKFILDSAKKHKVSLKNYKSYIDKVKTLQKTELYHGVSPGKLDEALKKAGLEGADADGFIRETNRIYNATMKKAREAREASVQPNVLKLDDKIDMSGYSFKSEKLKKTKKKEPTKFRVTTTDPSGKETVKIVSAPTNVLAEGYVIKNLRETVGNEQLGNIATQVRNGKYINKAAKEAGLSVKIREIKQTADLPDHVEVTFLDGNGKEVSYGNLPDNLQREAQLYLKTRGGKIKAADPADDLPIGQLLDENGRPLDLEGVSDPKAREDALQNAVSNALRRAKTEGGGKAALQSILRTVSEDKDYITIMRAVYMDHDDLLTGELEGLSEINYPRTTAGELLNPKQSLERLSKELSGALGGNPKHIQKAIRELEAKGENLKERFNELFKEQLAIKMINNMIGENLDTLAREASELLERATKTGDNSILDLYDVKYAQVLHMLEMLVSTQRIWGLYGRYPALAMLQRKFMFGEVKSHTFDDTLEGLEKQSTEAVQKYREARRGSMGQQKLLQLILTARTSDDIQAGLNKIAKESMGKRGMNMVREYYINSLLSGITTQTVNLLGSSITYALRTAETAAGAALSGDFDLAKATIRYAFDIHAFMDSLDLAMRAAKSGEAISIPNSRQFDDAQGAMDAIRSDRQDAFGSAINMLGTIVRLPSRGLLTGDELFKAMSYRTYVMTDLAMQGKNKGLTGNDLSEYVYRGIDAHVTETGRVFNEKNMRGTAMELARKKGLRFSEFDRFVDNYMRKNSEQKPFVTEGGVEIPYEDRGALAARAEQNAKVNTHTQDSENSIVKGLSRIVVDNPLLTAVIPFVRTPTNILGFAWERSPFGNITHVINGLNGKYKQILETGTARERAELKGKISMSVATTAGLAYMLASNDLSGVISGYGPLDKNKRKAWELNNQPYSIKIGDRIHSFQRLDPIATVLGIMADISEGMKYNQFDGDDLSNIFGLMSLALANNITNKSYVQGLDNLFKVIKDPLNNTQRFVGGIAGGFVPNFLNQALNAQEDRAIREVRNVMDYMMKRTPLEGQIPQRYNFLGDPETIEGSGGFKGVVDPIYSKDVADNIVDYEISNLNAGFGKPSHYLRPGVKDLDMREYYNPETGEQAYAQMMKLVGTHEIGGKTLRQRLTKLFNSKAYQNAPGVEIKDIAGTDSPKVKAVRKLISAYNVAARYEMLRQNPELYQRYVDAMKADRAARNQ